MGQRLLLVDDHRIFREGLRMLINRDLPELTVVAEAGTVTTAVEQAVARRPDLILMDIHLPDGDGIQTSARIRAELPEVRIIILSAEANLAYVKEAMRAGVTGYLLKETAAAELECAIRAVLKGEFYLCSAANHMALQDYQIRIKDAGANPKAELSARELQVLRLICEGLRTKEIASRLNVGAKTAETYRHRLLTKLQCSGTAELVRYALREGLFTP